MGINYLTQYYHVIYALLTFDHYLYKCVYINNIHFITYDKNILLWNLLPYAIDL